MYMPLPNTAEKPQNIVHFMLNLVYVRKNVVRTQP